ncbi:MAG: response regulator transcription factor [Acidimicrobiales bacterium]
MAARIVVAEDDPKQAQLLRLYLEREGHVVVVASDGREALEQVRRRQPDLMVLDIMMPEIDGLDVVRILRSEMQLPIIMVTGRSTEDDLLLGLDLGADDYLMKPYSPRELVARVRTVLRRTTGAVSEASEFVHGRLTVDVNRHKVMVEAVEIECTPREFDILATLASEPGRVFSRQQLLDAVFGWDYDGLERTIDVHMLNLRKKVEIDPADPQLLLTVFGVGYKMAEEAQ